MSEPQTAGRAIVQALTLFFVLHIALSGESTWEQSKPMRLLIITFFVMFITTSCVDGMSSQSVELTPEHDHIKVDKPGTVTFMFENDLHVSKAKEEGLEQISNLEFSAAIIYDIAFSPDGLVSSKGKVFNYTDEPVSIKFQCYSGEREVCDFLVDVKPRTFSRIVPEEYSDKVKTCDRIVCTD